MSKSPMKLVPFVAARYLDSDEAIAEYITAEPAVAAVPARPDPSHKPIRTGKAA